MAGHSHWAGIKHKKGRQDQLRSKIFSKISREITVAAKLGSKDPDSNPRLRSAIELAKEANMPKENINRAINKSETGNGENFENLRYEGFGPKKVVLIIEALTDNKNRTASGIRTILQKYGGNLGASGSTAHFFNNCGVIQISKENTPDEKILNFAAKAGAKDCFSYDIFHEIITKKEDFYRIKNQAEKLFSKITYSNIEWRPLNQVELKKIEKEEIESMLELLEQNDDVQNVFHNFKVV
jgi:YebC/PmpR family DNA-binding regulatory protein|tara:strand:- start:1216 stop:1935 length:720 start_codon:yes stop_codon:yes gene_type:complete